MYLYLCIGICVLVLCTCICVLVFVYLYCVLVLCTCIVYLYLCVLFTRTVNSFQVRSIVFTARNQTIQGSGISPEQIYLISVDNCNVSVCFMTR